MEHASDRSTLPPDYADRELKAGLSRALRRRGFSEADWATEIAELAERVIDGELSLAGASLRADVLRYAARANVATKTLEKARHFYRAFQHVGSSDSDKIYEALVADTSGDSDRALRLLRKESTNDARSCIFSILFRRKGANEALGWVDSENLKFSDFTPVAAVNILIRRVEVGQFERAMKLMDDLKAEDFSVCPALHLLKANLILASILPADQKNLAFQGLPLNPRMVQFASDVHSRHKIKLARAQIASVLSLADELDLKTIGEHWTEYDLWLQLEDSDTEQAARAKITEDLGFPAKTLQRIRLALAYGIPVNSEALKRHLQEQRKVGGWRDDERMAALLLAYHSKDHDTIAAFFDEYRDDFFADDQFPSGALAGIEVECLARAGRFEDARRRLSEHKSRFFTDEQAREIDEVIDSVEKGDELERARLHYEKSKTLTSLRVLVSELAGNQDHRQLANYAPALVKETRHIADFRVATRALFHENRHAELLELIENLPDLYALDDEFKSIKGWSLFHLGRVMEARSIARDLYSKRNKSDDRELAINTAIESGDWGYLQAIVSQELLRINNLDAETLMRLARLAFEAGSPYVDQFRDAALTRFPENPQVLLAAYMLAVDRGNEQHDERVHEWFQKAAELSGPKGPVQAVKLKELIDRAPAWNKRVDTIDAALRTAQVPIFLAAQALRRQPVDMFLGQAIRNAAAEKPRGQAPILAFSGARPLVDLSGVGRVALETTAILTLEYLGLLRDAINAFDSVIIAPTTLSTIFQERQFLRVRQPSQKLEAERLQKLITSKQLCLMPEGSRPPRFAHLKVGDDLAEMFRVAQQDGALVVRSAPIHKIGSLMDEEADLTEVTSVLA